MIAHRTGDLDDGEAELIRVPWTEEPGRRRRPVILLGSEAATPTVPRMRSETRARLLDGIARALLWLDDLVSGRVADTAAIALAEGCSERSVRMRLNLAFLSPELVRAAVAGTLPESHGLSVLTQASVCWQKQRLALQQEPTRA